MTWPFSCFKAPMGIWTNSWKKTDTAFRAPTQAVPASKPVLSPVETDRSSGPAFQKGNAGSLLNEVVAKPEQKEVKPPTPDVSLDPTLDKSGNPQPFVLQPKQTARAYDRETQFDFSYFEEDASGKMRRHTLTIFPNGDAIEQQWSNGMVEQVIGEKHGNLFHVNSAQDGQNVIGKTDIIRKLRMAQSGEGGISPQDFQKSMTVLKYIDERRPTAQIKTLSLADRQRREVTLMILSNVINRPQGLSVPVRQQDSPSS